MDLMTFITCAIIVLILYYIRHLYHKANSTRKTQLIDYLNNIVHSVSIEKIDGIDYWFDIDKSLFLAQGKNDDEVISVIKSRFPDHVFLVTDRGGIASNTDWKIVPFEELKTLILHRNER